MLDPPPLVLADATAVIETSKQPPSRQAASPACSFVGVLLPEPLIMTEAILGCSLHLFKEPLEEGYSPSWPTSGGERGIAVEGASVWREPEAGGDRERKTDNDQQATCMEAEQFEKKSDSCCHRDDGARLPVGELQAPKQRESADREAGQEQTVYGVLALEA